MKIYKLFIQYWSNQIVVKIVETNDLYHEIGKIHCESLEQINRIDYKELKSINECPVYDDCCKVCTRKRECKQYNEFLEKAGN